MRVLVCFILVGLSWCSAAEGLFASGTVKSITIANPDQLGDNNDYVKVEGIKTLGKCLTHEGDVLFRIPASMSKGFSALLSAQASGRPVTIKVDDAVVDGSGYCIIRTLKL